GRRRRRLRPHHRARCRGRAARNGEGRFAGVSELPLRPAEECRWDLVSLGEVMLRLDPGERRIATARTFAAWEGGVSIATTLRQVRSATVNDWSAVCATRGDG